MYLVLGLADAAQSSHICTDRPKDRNGQKRRLVSERVAPEDAGSPDLEELFYFHEVRFRAADLGDAREQPRGRVTISEIDCRDREIPGTRTGSGPKPAFDEFGTELRTRYLDTGIRYHREVPCIER